MKVFNTITLFFTGVILLYVEAYSEIPLTDILTALVGMAQGLINIINLNISPSVYFNLCTIPLAIIMPNDLLCQDVSFCMLPNGFGYELCGMQRT